MNGAGFRRFVQTFVLASKSERRYYVHNDMFRFLDENRADGAGAAAEHEMINVATSEFLNIKIWRPILFSFSIRFDFTEYDEIICVWRHVTGSLPATKRSRGVLLTIFSDTNFLIFAMYDYVLFLLTLQVNIHYIRCWSPGCCEWGARRRRVDQQHPNGSWPGALPPTCSSTTKVDIIFWLYFIKC